MIEAVAIKVLYVDDEQDNLTSFKATFRRYFEVHLASSAMEAEEILAKEKDIHILITDQRMPVKTGTELLAETVKKYPNQVRILLTGYSDIESLIDAINKGQLFRYLKKPWDDDLLKQTIEEGYQVFNLRQKERQIVEDLQYKIDELTKILNKKNNP